MVQDFPHWYVFIPARVRECSCLMSKKVEAKIKAKIWHSPGMEDCSKEIRQEAPSRWLTATRSPKHYLRHQICPSLQRVIIRDLPYRYVRRQMNKKLNRHDSSETRAQRGRRRSVKCSRQRAFSVGWPIVPQGLNTGEFFILH